MPKMPKINVFCLFFYGLAHNSEMIQLQNFRK